jgi:hypothetical protein
MAGHAHRAGLQPSQPVNPVDSKLFWMSLYVVSPAAPCQVTSLRLHPWLTSVARQFPAAWIVLLFVYVLSYVKGEQILTRVYSGILKFNVSFIPIVVLALVFNVTNTLGQGFSHYLYFSRLIVYLPFIF